MPVTMEGLTRPWAEPKVKPRPSITVPQAVAPDDLVRVHIGSPGGVTYQWHVLDQWQLTIGPLHDDSNFREVSKTVQTVRVTNPQDENQFVDVDQVKHIEFANSAGSRSTYDMKV